MGPRPTAAPSAKKTFASDISFPPPNSRLAGLRRRAVHIVERKRHAQPSGVGDQAARHLGRDCLALVFVMTHIALRAANGLGQRCLSQSEADSDRFDGVHDPIMSATHYQCQHRRCFRF